MANDHPNATQSDSTRLNASTATIFLLLAMVCTIPCSQAAEPAPRMTGERLLKQLEPVDPNSVAWGPESKGTREELAYLLTTRNIEYVQGYFAALYDATEGKGWCYDAKSKNPKPDSLWDESKRGLHQLPPAQLKRNATELLVEIWREKWPCALSEQRR